MAVAQAVTFAQIQESLISIADGVLMEPVSAEQRSAAVALQCSARSSLRSFKALRSIGTRYAIRFEELGDYETANMINATISEAF